MISQRQFEAYKDESTGIHYVKFSHDGDWVMVCPYCDGTDIETVVRHNAGCDYYHKSTCLKCSATIYEYTPTFSLYDACV